MREFPLTDPEHMASKHDVCDRPTRWMVVFLCVLLTFPFGIFETFAVSSKTPSRSAMEQTEPESPAPPLPQDSSVYLDADILVREPGDYDLEGDTIPTVVTASDSPYGLDGKKIFNPSPDRAVWLSALFPGLGQIYNRRYWKLPIVVGGFMGLGYATSWNNKQLTEYTQAYRDISDSDPSSNSYMNFFPPTVKEEDLDKAWLTSTLRSRRDFYRRNRDLCIICLVGMYLVCMIDAYVDASLAHFDISPDLSLDWSPAILLDRSSERKVSLGLNWAFTF